MRRTAALAAIGLALLAPLLSLPAYATGGSTPSTGVSAVQTAPPAWAAMLPKDTTQVVRTVSSTKYCAQVYCTVTQAWVLRAGTWTMVKEFRSVIGPHGWGKTHEGDLRSPVGVFRIAVTFSTGPKNPGHMPWRRRTATTIVSTTDGPDYNTWVTMPGATSGNRPSMRYGWVVDYNNVRLTPGIGPKPVPYKGAGIFYHTSRPGAPWAPTDGCTQVGIPAQMAWLERWLRPQDDPRIVQDL